MSEARSSPQAVPTDGALARAISVAPASGAPAEEAELYRRFAPRIRLYGHRHLRDDMAADDLAQEVMLVTIEKLRAGEVRNPDEIASFILGTSRMIARDRRRREYRRQALRERFLTIAPPAQPAPGEAPEAADLDRLESCLGGVSDRERTVLILTFYAETPAVDIAGRLGVSAGAVRVIRHRAIARLRECLAAAGVL